MCVCVCVTEWLRGRADVGPDPSPDGFWVGRSTRLFFTLQLLPIPTESGRGGRRVAGSAWGGGMRWAGERPGNFRCVFQPIPGWEGCGLRGWGLGLGNGPATAGSSLVHTDKSSHELAAAGAGYLLWVRQLSCSLKWQTWRHCYRLITVMWVKELESDCLLSMKGTGGGLAYKTKTK